MSYCTEIEAEPSPLLPLKTSPPSPPAQSQTIGRYWRKSGEEFGDYMCLVLSLQG